MRYIATLLGLLPALGFIAPLPQGTEGATPNLAGTYNNCSVLGLLPAVPPQKIEITTSFGGGVNDVVITPGVGATLPVVRNTFIADGVSRDILVNEFGVPVGAERMCAFEIDPPFERLVVEQTDDFFGTSISREITIERNTNNDRLEYHVAFGPFIVYAVRCDCVCNPLTGRR